MDVFSITKKIYYHDTDWGGVVYYANYLKFFEEARAEHLLSKGIDLTKLAKKGIFFVVAGLDITYKKPARYGDKLLITSKIEKKKPVSLHFYHEAKREESALVECRTTLVSIGINFKPKSMPAYLSALLSTAS